MMNTLKQSDLNRQRGAASLLTALVLLIGITLITFTTSKTVLVETQMTADNYRVTQAVAAANYAMDYGVNYFDNGGFDQNDDGTVDTVDVPDLTSADGNQTTSATLIFNNAACGATGSDMKNGMITAQGFSDDGLATRTITQCVGPLNVLQNGGPKQPLVAQGNIGLTGNARIINRYTNTTVWAGGKTKIGSSSAMETYIKDSVSGTLTQAELLDTEDSNNAQLVSNRNLGNGLDIIDDDPSLGSLVGLEFFKNFFSVDSRAQLKELAGEQSYTSINSAFDKSGLIWIEGNQSMNGGTIGSIAKPAILVINGDFTLAGNANIYGLLYVTGTYTVSGTPQVIGSNIVEGTNLETGAQATPPIVTGNGTVSLVFWPAFGAGSDDPIPGLTAVISGSWRDW
jgi:Tfp pilus assembly protein PilX